MEAPVILIGMHRSGTSMVTRALARLGLFAGWELDSNAEAIFFVLRNEAILEAQGGRWDNPAPVDRLLSEERLRSQLREALRRELESPAAISFLGPIRYLRSRSLLRLGFPWGWKDPRNTLLLPLWLEIFPDARVVHVVRNGVDVALSLARREAQRLEHVILGKGRLTDALGVSGRPEGVNSLAWLWSQAHLRLGRGSIRRRLGRWRVHPVIEIQKGFELWAEYLKRAEAALPLVKAGAFVVRYEDVLADPVEEITRLADYCCLPMGRERIRAVAGSVKQEGGGRFHQDPEARELYGKVRASEWMRKWGYDV